MIDVFRFMLTSFWIWIGEEKGGRNMKRFRICLRSSQPDTRLNVRGQGKKAFKSWLLGLPWRYTLVKTLRASSAGSWVDPGQELRSYVPCSIAKKGGKK